MNQPNIILGLINIASALLFIALSIPLVKRKIKMNDLYGFRISKAFKSEENWFNINAYGGKQLITWSILMIGAGVACFFIPIKDTNEGALSLVLGVGPMTIVILIVVVKTLLYAHKL